jgi:hypothetical protein
VTCHVACYQRDQSSHQKGAGYFGYEVYRKGKLRAGEAIGANPAFSTTFPAVSLGALCLLIITCLRLTVPVCSCASCRTRRYQVDGKGDLVTQWVATRTQYLPYDSPVLGLGLVLPWNDVCIGSVRLRVAGAVGCIEIRQVWFGHEVVKVCKRYRQGAGVLFSNAKRRGLLSSHPKIPTKFRTTIRSTEK